MRSARPSPLLGELPPLVDTSLPGAVSARMVEVLARAECPAITARRARRAEASGAPHDPIVWAAARGRNVEDADGNVYVDLAGGFGVAALGHAHPEVTAAVRDQAERLLHGFGDVHPSAPKVALLERLAALAPWPDARVILGLSGSDAVEAALKTAMLHTGRPGVLAFDGGYHGLAFGPLAACGYSDAFRAPFRAQLNPHVVFAPYPRAGADLGSSIEAVAHAWAERSSIGAVLVEPVLGRGGVVPPPPGFLRALAELTRARGAILVADEVLTGLGRCGARWRSVDDGAVPDLICAGKALGGGLPISACLGRSEVMAAWGHPSGEALHTSTFLGHPLACAAALASLEVIERDGLAEVAARNGAEWLSVLRAGLAPSQGVQGVVEVRGAGMLLGVELERGSRTLAVVRRLLERGWITLPAASDARVLQILPPLATPVSVAETFVAVLAAVLAEVP